MLRSLEMLFISKLTSNRLLNPQILSWTERPFKAKFHKVPMTLDIHQIEEAGKAVEEAHQTLQSLMEQRTQIYLRQRENEIVLEELGFLNADEDKVLKQVGPALIEEDLQAAKDNIQHRLEFMEGNLKTLDEKILATQKISDAAEKKLQQMQSSLK